MGYWDATDQYLSRHGKGLCCPTCGKTMVPMDDHGRFICGCNFGEGVDVVTGTPVHIPKLPQVDTVGMSDEEKAGIPPIHRLHSKPTAAEAKFLSMTIDDMDTPEYREAVEALEREREELPPG